MKKQKFLAGLIVIAMLTSRVSLYAQIETQQIIIDQDMNKDGIIDLYDMVSISKGTDTLIEEKEVKEQNAKISYVVPEQVSVGDTFDIIINVSEIQDLYGGSLDITYDPELIEIQSMRKGDVFDENILMPINTIGKNKASIVLLQKGNIPGVAVENPTSLMILTVKAVGTGTLELGNNAVIKLSNSNAKPINYSKETAQISIVNKQVPKEVNVNIPEFKVTINREEIDNKRNKYPLITYNGVTYLPLTWDYCQALGVSMTFDETQGLSVNQTGSTAPIKQDLTGDNILGGEYTAVQPVYKIKANGKAIDNSKEEFPILNFRDVTYFPMTWKFAVEEFGWETHFDGEKGFFVSSIGSIQTPVTGIELNKTELTLTEGAQETLEALIKPEYAYNKRIIWDTENNEVATVDQNGTVTGNKPGSTIITATTEDGHYQAKCKVIVTAQTQEPQPVKVIIPEFNVTINREKIDNQRNQYPLISYNNVTYVPLTWDYSQALGLGTTFSEQKGLVVYQTNTTAPVKQDLTANNILGGEYNALQPNYAITVNGKAVNNATEEYPVLSFRDVTYFPLTWKFAVEEFGWETHFEGEKGFFISSIGAINVPVEGISLNEKSLELEIGQTGKLRAEVKPGDAYNQNIIWNSSNTAVATVDQNGKISAVSSGTTTITVTTEEGGYHATCKVTVRANEPEDDTVEVMLPDFDVTVNGTKINNKKNLYPMITYQNITYAPMTWDYCQALGLGSNFDETNGLSIVQTGTSAPVNQDLTGNNELGVPYKAEIPTYNITVNGRYIDNSVQSYPILNFRGITYFPLTWEFAVEEFGWTTHFDTIDGFVISSN